MCVRYKPEPPVLSLLYEQARQDRTHPCATLNTGQFSLKIETAVSNKMQFETDEKMYRTPVGTFVALR